VSVPSPPCMSYCVLRKWMISLRPSYVLQCVAVCCSVLQWSECFLVLPIWAIASYVSGRFHVSESFLCVAVCCSVLQRVGACCSVLQRAATCCSVLQCVVVCCSVLQCVAVCCSVLQCVAVCCSVSSSLYVLRKWMAPMSMIPPYARECIICA